MSNEQETEFERAAARHSRSNLCSDLWYFLREQRKWWLMPIVLVLLLLGLVMVLSTTGAAPFIYTLF